MIRHKHLALFCLTLGAWFQFGFTCEYEFEFRGSVKSSADSSEIAGAKAFSVEYDLYAIDPEENNRHWWEESAATDSNGYYRGKIRGLYDCGPGRPNIRHPLDLGWVHIHVEAEGYLPLDTSLHPDSLTEEGNYYTAPDLLLKPYSED